MRTPEEMNPVELKGLARKRGLKPANNATKDELLAMLKKKGKPTWRPAQKLDVSEKDPNFRYRWCDKDEVNLQKKQEEGWIFVNKSTGVSGKHENPGDSGVPTSSVTEYRELRLMALPQEDGNARDEYHQELTQKQTVGLKKKLQSDLDDSAQAHGGSRTTAHGSIIIE